MSVTFHTVACDHVNLAFRLFAESVIGVTGDGLHTAAQREMIVFLTGWQRPSATAFVC